MSVREDDRVTVPVPGGGSVSIGAAGIEVTVPDGLRCTVQPPAALYEGPLRVRVGWGGVTITDADGGEVVVGGGHVAIKGGVRELAPGLPLVSAADVAEMRDALDPDRLGHLDSLSDTDIVLGVEAEFPGGVRGFLDA